MAKKDFAAASRTQGREPFGCEKAEKELGKFANEASGYAALHEQLKAACAQQGLTQIQIISEATGGYEAALVAYGYENHWLVSMPGCPLGPKQGCDWAKGVGYRVKTDRIDAPILAHYGVERQPALRPPMAQAVTELDSLLKRRLDLEQALQKEETRRSELTGRPGLSPKVAESLHQVITALTEALTEIQTAIDTLCQSHEPFAQNQPRLLALPGIGPKTVLPLLVKLFQWQTLTSGQGAPKGHPQGLTAFVGLDPQPYESGGCPLGAGRKHPGISKKDANEIRRLLYMGALGGVRSNNPLKAFYKRLVGRGKAKKLALVAAARKILVWAWNLFSRQTDWNPDLHQIGP